MSTTLTLLSGMAVAGISAVGGSWFTRRQWHREQMLTLTASAVAASIDWRQAAGSFLHTGRQTYTINDIPQAIQKEMAARWLAAIDVAEGRIVDARSRYNRYQTELLVIFGTKHRISHYLAAVDRLMVINQRDAEDYSTATIDRDELQSAQDDLMRFVHGARHTSRFIATMRFGHRSL